MVAFWVFSIIISALNFGLATIALVRSVQARTAAENLVFQTTAPAFLLEKDRGYVSLRLFEKGVLLLKLPSGVLRKHESQAAPFDVDVSESWEGKGAKIVVSDVRQLVNFEYVVKSGTADGVLVPNRILVSRRDRLIFRIGRR